MSEDAGFAAQVKNPVIEKPFDMRQIQALVRGALLRRDTEAELTGAVKP
jgi:hypothetical protein